MHIQAALNGTSGFFLKKRAHEVGRKEWWGARGSIRREGMESIFDKNTVCVVKKFSKQEKWFLLVWINYIIK